MKSNLPYLVLLVAVLGQACSDGTGPTDPIAADGALIDEHLGRNEGAGRLTVMTQNLYVGADVDAVITALATPDPDDDIPALLAAVATVERTDFPARANALARKIARERPAVVGLQEVSTLVVELPPLGVSTHQDFLQILLDALHARGLDYQAAIVGQNLVATPAPGISLTDFDAMLVDARQVQVLEASAHRFSANLGVVAPGVDLERGWVQMTASIGGRTFTFASLHTEGTGPEELLLQLHAAQVSDVVASLGTATPAIVMGDFNAVPGSPAYQVMQGGGFTDVWAALRPGTRGFTCCHAADLSDLRAEFTERIDYVWARGLGEDRGRSALAGTIDRYGEVPSDRLPNSNGELIWPSDHAGLVTTILRAPGHDR